MSHDIRDDGSSSPTSWPTDPHAGSALADWAAGGLAAHLYATDTDFDGANLGGLTFFYFYGPGCRFRHAVLRETDFGGGFLPESDFSGADLRRAGFAKTELTNSVFDRADMAGAHLVGAQMEGASFVDSVLQDASIGGTLRRCIFARTNLRHTRFVAPDARGAEFVSVDLEGAWGEMIGPVRTLIDAETVDLSGNDAESWFRSQGANITVLAID